MEWILNYDVPEHFALVFRNKIKTTTLISSPNILGAVFRKEPRLVKKCYKFQLSRKTQIAAHGAL